MRCEKSFVTIKFIWHGYLVSSLSICAHKIPTETGLSAQWIMHARLCLIITLPHFISSQSLLSVVFTPRVQLPSKPVSFAFPACDCRQDSLQMHSTRPHNSNVSFYFPRAQFISTHILLILKLLLRSYYQYLPFFSPCFLA